MNTRALVCCGPTACRTVYRLRSPAWLLVTLIAGLASTLAIASTLAFILAFGLATTPGIFETPPVRRRRVRRAARHARRARRDRHEARLEQADAPTRGFVELAEVVEHTARVDERSAAELEPLLDQYVEVTLERRRTCRALEHSEPARLELQLAIANERHPRQARVLERRIAHSRQLVQRLARLDDSIAELSELVRYQAERATLPEIDPLFDDDVLADALAHHDACEEVSEAR